MDNELNMIQSKIMHVIKEWLGCLNSDTHKNIRNVILYCI